jgi:hypothetical protein
MMHGEHRISQFTGLLRHFIRWLDSDEPEAAALLAARLGSPARLPRRPPGRGSARVSVRSTRSASRQPLVDRDTRALEH